jgi:anti-sigma regulatory factor (Ser/Thr protein kinase)
MRQGTTRGPPGARSSPTVEETGSNGERVLVARLGIVPGLAAPSEARAFVAEIAPEHPRLPDLLLGISELVTNAVRYGSIPEGGLLAVATEANASRTRLEVSYPGPVFVPPAGSPAPDIAAGRGLAIVDAIADRWGIVQSEEMIVWFEIDH